jgi:serine/threonine protein kinase
VSDACKRFIIRCLDKDFLTRPTITEIIKDPWITKGYENTLKTDNIFGLELVDVPNVLKFSLKKHMNDLFKKNNLENVR